MCVLACECMCLCVGVGTCTCVGACVWCVGGLCGWGVGVCHVCVCECVCLCCDGRGSLGSASGGAVSTELIERELGRD